MVTPLRYQVMTGVALRTLPAKTEIPALLSIYFCTLAVWTNSLRSAILVLLMLFLIRGLVYIHQQTEFAGSVSLGMGMGSVLP